MIQWFCTRSIGFPVKEQDIHLCFKCMIQETGACPSFEWWMSAHWIWSDNSWLSREICHKNQSWLWYTILITFVDFYLGKKIIKVICFPGQSAETVLWWHSCANMIYIVTRISTCWYDKSQHCMYENGYISFQFLKTYFKISQFSLGSPSVIHTSWDQAGDAFLSCTLNNLQELPNNHFPPYSDSHNLYLSF